MAERIGKMLAVAAFNNTGLAMFLLKAHEMKKMVIPGTISESYRMGKAIHKAKEIGNDPLDAISQSEGRWLLFQGEVIEKQWAVEDGYYVGTHRLKGLGDYQGQEYKIWFKNENHVIWLNGEVHVMSPDMICQVDRNTLEPLTNHALEEGREVAIIGLAARPVHRLKDFLGQLAPRHYGFDIDYLPIEQLMKSQR
jgi:uncharacterized protein